MQSRRCRLVVLGMEVGGRWSTEAYNFIRTLAKYKARSKPSIIRKSVQIAYTQRWTGLLSVAAQRAFAATLLEQPLNSASTEGEEEPFLEDVLLDARLVETPAPSRLH